MIQGRLFRYLLVARRFSAMFSNGRNEVIVVRQCYLRDGEAGKWKQS